MLKEHQDAFGREIYDYYHGQESYEIIERDDGFFSLSPGPRLYFLEYEDWPEADKRAIRYARGRVLDIGAGAGRHSLYLQAQGLEVLGIDNSPLAVEVCQQRGLRNARVLPLAQISSKLGVFDTILMMGNNFALLGNPDRARRLLKRFHGMTAQDARIVAQTRDPYATEVPEHLEYHSHNRQRGKLSGQARIRVRYKKYVTPWIEFLMLSQAELETLLRDEPWRLSEFIPGQGGNYVAILEKER